MTQLHGGSQMMDGTLPLSKLVAAFLNGSDWNITNGTRNATITGLKNPVNAGDAATKEYVDGVVDSTLKSPDEHDASTGYPTLYKGNAIQAGDTWYITVGGTMGSMEVDVGDLLVAKVDGATGNGDFYAFESNRMQATESVLGMARIADQLTTDAGTDDTTIVTPLKLATYLANAGIQGITAENGLDYNETTGVLTFGGNPLNHNTLLELGGYELLLASDPRSGTSSGVRMTNSDIQFGQAEVGYFESSNSTNKFTFRDTRSSGSELGIEYFADYSASFTDRSLVDKGYVENRLNSVKEYFVWSPGTLYPANVLIQEQTTNEKVFYWSLQEFTSSGLIETDVGSGYMQAIVGSGMMPVYGSPQLKNIRANELFYNNQTSFDLYIGVSNFVPSGVLVNDVSGGFCKPLFEATQGLTKNSNKLSLGGAFDTNIDISGTDGSSLMTRVANAYGGRAQMLVDSTKASLSTDYDGTGTIGYKLELNQGGDAVFTDLSAANGGLKYAADYSASFTARSLIDKEYVDDAVAGFLFRNGIRKDSGDGYVKLGGPLTENTNINFGGVGFGYSYALSTLQGVGLYTYADSGHNDDSIEIRAGGNSGLKFYRYSGSADYAEFRTGHMEVNIPSGNGLFKIYDDRALPEGFVYALDYSASFVDESLITKRYVDNTVANTQKIIQREIEFKTFTPNTPAGKTTVAALTNLGTHATDKVVRVTVYVNGILQEEGALNDFEINKTTGVVVINRVLSASEKVAVLYSSQNA